MKETKSPTDALRPDLDRAEGLIRMVFVKLRVDHLEWPEDRKQIELYHEVKGLASDALRALGRHSDQKEAHESKPFDENEGDSHRLSGFRGYMS